MTVKPDNQGAPAPLSRKAAQRERDRTQGVKRIEFRLSPELSAMLEQGAKLRGGIRGEYSLQEYIETLIERDSQELQIHLDQLKAVQCKCGKSLPEGCGGFFKEESDCFHHTEYRQLLLREPPRLMLTESQLDKIYSKD